MPYDELVKLLRNCTSDTVEDCAGCPYQGGYKGTYCMNGLITEAADAIEELSKPKWIPVTERLPENQQFVLAWKDEKPKGFACICLWMDNAGWAFKNITHWMPLPEPPKEETA